jgi:hypothetical protein
MIAANHRERQFMQYLRGAGWVSVGRLPSSRRTIAGLITKGWIEMQGVGEETCYRITETGLAAKKAPVRIYG